jgi:hypothetical protein
MVLYEIASHWWSDIVQTEFRLSQKRNIRESILPPKYPRIRFSLVSCARRTTKAILARVRGIFAHQPRAEPSVSCADPAEAYMHACIVATFFCYVSPELYGLADATDEQGAPLRNDACGDGS